MVLTTIVAPLEALRKFIISMRAKCAAEKLANSEYYGNGWYRADGGQAVLEATLAELDCLEAAAKDSK